MPPRCSAVPSEFMGSLTIHLEDLKESPRPFRLECDRGWWEHAREILREPEVSMVRPLVVEVSGHRLGLRLLFRGTLSGALELTCGRCLEPYLHPLREEIQLLLEPARATDEIPAGGIALDPEEEGLGRYGGDELDFDPVVHELLALTWPMQPVCEEGCLGLCPVCGVNRNRGTCACSTEGHSRPFSDLGKLLEARRRSQG